MGTLTGMGWDGMEQIKIGLRQKNYCRENGSSSFDSLNS